MEIKVKMHTLLNRLALWILFHMFIVASFFIYRDAASNQLRIIGLSILLILFVGVMYLFVFKLCVYDYVIFKADGIELRTPFKKKAFFKYNEVIACFAEYTSIVEQKKYLTFTNKKYNSIVTHIDTSKFGNTLILNKMQVVYVPMNEKLIDFLKQATDLQWIASK